MKAEMHVTKLPEIIQSFRFQTGSCREFGSPFTADLIAAAGDALERGGVLQALLGEWPGNPMTDVLPIRLAGALHAVVLTGRDADLASCYPGDGRAGDGAAAWRAAEPYIESHFDWFTDWLKSPPQTNETRRSAALMAGLLTLAADCKLPFALLELGASAGLNLNLDRFRYETASWRWGTGEDVVIDTAWTGQAPPLVPFEIAARAGCDQNPLDPSSAEDRLRLTAFVWADQTERLDRLRRALDLAARAGTKVEKADAADWIEARMAARPDGRLTVVYHSIFYNYPPQATRDRIDAAIRSAGAAATETAPLAWLRFEWEGLLGGKPGSLRCVLDLITWPGGERRLLAEVDPHGRSVTWLA